MPPRGSRLDRRVFLVRGGAAVAAVTALAGLPYALRKELTRETSFVLFSPQQQQTIEAVQEHLYPKGPDYPGATDIGAARYLEWAITVPETDPDIRNTIAVCDGCHGKNGASTDDAFPILAGQELHYLYVQLKDFKSGSRKNLGISRRHSRLGVRKDRRDPFDHRMRRRGDSSG